MLRPGLLYGARAMARGPLFWPGMAMAITAATIPLVALAAAYRGADANDRPPLIGLFVAGVLSYGGGLSNAVLLSTGIISPLPMLTVLASLFLTAHVIRTLEPQDERRVLERSLLYAAVAAFLSAGFLFGVMQLVSISPPAGIGQYRLGAFFLLCMAAMAFEPLRQHLLEVLARRFVPNRAPAVALARALAQQETRADQVERLAELGALASAVAHEIRNPLGVMTVLLKRLEKSGPPSAIEAMREQIDRASHFADDLLAYGRPRPLELRRVDLAATAQLAATTAQQGHRGSTEHVSIEVEGEAVVEADQHQILQTLVVLIDNALLALADRQSGRIALDIVA
ncbi:MAG: histidine kinase dimerization/phospho-acceptor domain-containing protein, partial [Myxococcota bacterium]